MEEILDETIINEIIKTMNPDLSEKDRALQATAIQNTISKGIPLKDSLHLSMDSLDFLYNQGFRLYMIKKYSEAIKYFHLLYILYPQDARFSFGVAATYHQLKEWDQAIAWYFILSMIDAGSPLPYYYLSDCYNQQKDTASEIMMLKKALDKCQTDSKFSQLMERIERTLEKLEIEKKASQKRGGNV